MRIIEHQFLTLAEVEERLRRVPLRGFGNPFIYESATIQLVENGYPKSLAVAQKFVLRPTVDNILEVADAFEKRGHDVFALKGALLFWKEGMDPKKDDPIPFLPPIVEQSYEDDGRVVKLINDGMHRAYAAGFRRHRQANYIYISGVPREYPYYAHALKDNWWEVKEIDELTEGFQKKEYRNPENYKALFRQFNAVFPGVQEQRIQTQAHLKA